MNGTTGISGAPITGTVFDYLNPDILRPDLYEQQSYIVKDIRGPSSTNQTNSIYYTIAVIILSAVIFVVIVAWTDVLRSWFDSKYINSIISLQTKSRIYFAITVSIIGFIVISIIFYLYYSHIHR